VEERRFDRPKEFDMDETQHTTRRGRLWRLTSTPLALIVACVLTYGTAFGAVGAGAEPAATSYVPRNPIDAVAAMQPSWNLGNTLDAIPDETSWGNPLATKSLFGTIRAQGFRSVRIPVTWSGHQSATSPYAIDPAFMTRVKQVADWALADDLYVVLNIHHDSWQWIATMAADHDNVRARYDASWKQIAAQFKDAPAKLLFESVNEPVFTNATDTQKVQFLNELNTSFHTIVRQSGGRNATRLLVLPTQGCTPDQKLMDDLATTMSSLHDPNLVATVHFYGFWPFSVNIAGYTRFTAEVLKDMTDAFARMRNTFVAKGIPVYLGEYGLLGYPDHFHPDTVERGEALKYFEALGHQARISGVTSALWDPFSLLNRSTLQWRDPGLFAQISSSWTARSATASSDLVFVPKSGPVKESTLTLNLNGTSFLGLRQGSTWLIRGRDYTVAGDRLTLTAAALTRLAGNRSYGVNATLQAIFSRGVPWRLSVITNDPPVLSNATGTTASFAVPTQFRGDVLATMEAKYADGSNAGPDNWTSYKAFNTAFSPDYPNNTITLAAAFFDAVNDGARVTLAFHFWSGATATYSVTKSGTSVTGTTS
jgi:aryl-phospho-beta-D-glucosidase BglC (GH1 family)